MRCLVDCHDVQQAGRERSWRKGGAGEVGRALRCITGFACLPAPPRARQVGIASFGTDLPETASEDEVLKVGAGAEHAHSA